MNVEQTSRRCNAEADSFDMGKKADHALGSERHAHRCVSAGVLTLTRTEDDRGDNTGSPCNGVARTEPAIREDRTGLAKWRRGLAVPKTQPSAWRGNRPRAWKVAQRRRYARVALPITLHQVGNSETITGESQGAGFYQGR